MGRQEGVVRPSEYPGRWYKSVISSARSRRTSGRDFLFFGAFGSGEKNARYQKMDFSCANALSRGVEIRRVAVWNGCAVKDVFRYISKGRYLVLEVYDRDEKHLFNLSQNQLSELFLQAETPYDTLQMLKNRQKTAKSG